MKFAFNIILLLISIQLSAQNSKPTASINGTYHLLEAERGVTTKLFEFSKHNGEPLLFLAA